MALASSAASPSQVDPDRSRTLDEILGHGMICGFLRRLLAADRLPQSLLLAGPAGVGKKTLAWALMREIAARGEDPATALGAKKIARATHPDARLCDGSASASGQITIQQIRDEIEDWIVTAPLESPRKIALISPAEQMNKSAANCLLKLLEEPPPHAMFILTTLDPQRLLPTVRSRCTLLTLEAVPHEELKAWLERQVKSESSDRIELAARLSEGRPGYALSILKAGGLDRRREILQELNLLNEHGFAAVFRVADRLASLDASPEQTLDMALLLLRDALALRMNTQHILNVDLRGELEAFADQIPPEGLLEAATRLTSASGELQFYYTPQAKAHYLELLTVEIGRRFKGR